MRVLRIEEHRGVAADLRHRAGSRGCDRAAASHGLERGSAEPLVQAREDQAGRPAVKGRELVAADEPPRLRAGWKRKRLVTPTREHEAQLRTLAAQLGECLEEASMVLVRPGPGGIQEERLPRFVAGREADVIDTMVNHVHALGRDAESRDDSLLHERARNDHGCRSSGGAVVREPPERELRSGEHAWEVEVLDVVDGHHAWQVEWRHRNGERVVNELEAVHPLT